jgi:hypothetical protein
LAGPKHEEDEREEQIFLLVFLRSKMNETMKVTIPYETKPEHQSLLEAMNQSTAITFDDFFGLLNSIEQSYQPTFTVQLSPRAAKKYNGMVTGIWYKTPKRLRGTRIK